MINRIIQESNKLILDVREFFKQPQQVLYIPNMHTIGTQILFFQFLRDFVCHH